MKKFFLTLLALVCLSIGMQAKVAYLVPSSSSTDKTALPAQYLGYNLERTAYDWFNATYVTDGNGAFINFTGIPSDTTTYKAIWVYVDRELANDWVDGGTNTNFNLDQFNALFTDEVVNKLKAYVQAGGNLFLCKQATYLAYRMGRISYAPNYSSGGYSADDRTWGIKAKLGFGITDQNMRRDRSGHPMYSGLSTATMDNYEGCYPLLTVDGDGCSTDNNCHWNDFLTPNESGTLVKNPDNNADVALLNGWENYWSARCLGTWTSVGDYCILQAVEFFPATINNVQFKGTVMTMSIGAYQWGYDVNGTNVNKSIENVKKLTSNTLAYLSAPTAADVKLDEAFLSTGRQTDDATKFMVLHSSVEGMDGSYSVDDPNSITATVQDADFTRLKFKQAGTVTLHVNLTANKVGCDYNKWAHGTYSYAKTITFAYTDPDEAQTIANADLSSNGRASSDATSEDYHKFMLLHPKMRGMDSLAYEVSYDGIEVANQAEVVKVKDGDATRLVFTKAGTVNLKVKLNEPNIVIGHSQGEHNVTKTVTFAFDKTQLEMAWPTELNTARVSDEVTLPAEAEGLAVSYSFDPVANVSWDAENHKVKFLTAGDVKITASVTEENYVTTWAKGTYTEEKTVAVTSPIYWSQVPDIACVGETNKKAIATATSGTITYSSDQPDYVSIDQEGNLTFKKDYADSITITASVTVDDKDYSITGKTYCNKPEVKWETAPAESGVVGDSLNFETKLYYGPATIQYELSGCTIVNGKIVLGNTVGTATVKPYVQYTYSDTEILTYYGEQKTIYVQPDLAWTTEPQSGCIGEDKYAIAETSAGTVIYSSSNENLVKVSEEGKLIYQLYTEAGKATIKAQVKLASGDIYTNPDGSEYAISGEVDVTLPNVYWLTAPAETATYGDEMVAEAKVQYGNGVVQYEVENCTWANNKLTFLAAGTATVQPYVVYTVDANSQRYNGEKKSITVNELTCTRNVKSAYSTICLPYAATWDANVKAVYTMAGVQKDASENITAIALDAYNGAALEAGKPYIFKTEASASNPLEVVFTEFGTKADLQPVNGMIGTSEDIVISATQNGHEGYIYYLATDDMIHLIANTATVNIGATKAYFDLYEAASVAPAPGRVFMPAKGGEVTGLSNINADAVSVKLLRNGQIYILRGNRIFNLNGQLVK